MERRSREQNFRLVLQGFFNGFSNLVGGLVNIAELVRFINDDLIPIRRPDIAVFVTSEMKRTNDDAVLLVKGVEVAVLNLCVECLGFQDDGRDKKLIGEFLAPLFPQAGWGND